MPARHLHDLRNVEILLQRDYTLSLKLQVVQEIKSGQLSTTAAQRKYGIQARSTVVSWLRKYGGFDWENRTASHMPAPSYMPDSPQKKIIKLEQQIRLLEKQNQFLKV